MQFLFWDYLFRILVLYICSVAHINKIFLCLPPPKLCNIKDNVHAILTLTASLPHRPVADWIFGEPDSDVHQLDLDVNRADLEVDGADLDVNGADLDVNRADLEVDGAHRAEPEEVGGGEPLGTSKD